MTAEQDIERTDAVNALLDALAYPAGRDVRKAWNTCCFLFGRTGWKISPVAIEQYADEQP